MFQRLIGLETEYALHLPSTAGSSRRTRYGLFRTLVAELGKKLPTVPARHMKEGVFHAAGGAVWFETERPASGGGLIEGSTPECRSPKQLLIWQRAQDELLAESVDDAFGGSVQLIKNDRDARGNVYGAQESYELTLATGWRLWLWRVLLVTMFPAILLTWLALWLMDRAVVLYVLAATVIYLTGERLLHRPEWLSRLLFGCDIKDLESDLPIGPVWLESVLAVLTRVVTAPLAALLVASLWLTAFSRVRRQMLPFLISRQVLAGAGYVDERGGFQLSDKAAAINCVLGLGGFALDRPILSMGHFFKIISSEPAFLPGDYLRLFSARQRLQVALGDSNMAEVAEYLRIGTTLLVLDALEAGELPACPRVRRPIRALRTLCADPTLSARVGLAGGQSATALEIQRFYLEACRRFLDGQPDAPAEARKVLQLWEQTLDALTADPDQLIGSLDWVTKQFVLAKSGRHASWEARKKIDIRYHELSPQGYFERLKATGAVRTLVQPIELRHARRNPPSGTPASARGRYIREFAVEGEDVTANWRAIYIGSRFAHRRVIHLVRQEAKSSGKSARRKKRKDASEN